MARKKKDTDYLAISARLHVLETRLLTRERMEQMVEARDDAEAVKIMADCGYPEPSPLTLTTLEAALGEAQRDLFQDLTKALDDPQVLDVFRLKYDYHNAKVLLKSEARGVDPQGLMVEGGRWTPKELLEGYRAGDLSGCTSAFREAVAQARELLAASQDPQRSDFLLDRACWGETLAAAEKSRSPFLIDYVKLSIDALNLKAAVRASRTGRGSELLRSALIPGGAVDVQALPGAGGEALERLYRSTRLAAAAQAGAELLAGRGSMTAFERLCDDAVTGYVAQARRVPFGVETAVGYLYARQTEQTALRTILSGRLAGLDKDVIRERLREAYV